MMRFFFAPTQNRFDSFATALIIVTTLIQGIAAGLVLVVGLAIISAHFQRKVEVDIEKEKENASE